MVHLIAVEAPICKPPIKEFRSEVTRSVYVDLSVGRSRCYLAVNVNSEAGAFDSKNRL